MRIIFGVCVPCEVSLSCACILRIELYQRTDYYNILIIICSETTGHSKQILITVLQITKHVVPVTGMPVPSVDCVKLLLICTFHAKSLVIDEWKGTREQKDGNCTYVHILLHVSA